MTDISRSNESDTLQSGGNVGATSGGSSSTGGGNTTADKFKSQFAGFKSQAGDKARDYAGQGKTRATDALDEASRFLEDTARTIEEKLGPQYGRYGFSAAESVSGFASQMRDKDVDEIVEDVRSFVRKSPAVAIGAAVGLGFVLARLAKAGAGFESDYRNGGGADDTTGATQSLASTGAVTGGSTGVAGSTGTTSTGVGAGTPTTGVGTGGLGGTTDANDPGSPINPTFPA